MNEPLPSEVASICGKIEHLLAHKKIDLRSRFDCFDPKQTGLISLRNFFIIVFNDLARDAGICRENVEMLANHFGSRDGVCYKKFLDIVESKPHSGKPFVTGLEWEDHQQINVLSPFETRHLNLILTKIAYSCRLRDVNLLSHFQDYERVSGNSGTVTLHQFKKILNFAGITLGPVELQLISKRYIKHGYTINYLAFVGVIDNIMKWFESHGFLDCDKSFHEHYPGRIIVAGVDSLPRPEIGKIDVSEMFGTEKVCHPSLKRVDKRCHNSFQKIMLRIKKHILDNAIRTREFFEKFDELRRGFITKSQFSRGLDAIGISGLHRLSIDAIDLETIFDNYKDLCDPERVAWSRFCDDIDEVFTIKCLDKQPLVIVECPPEEVKELPCPGAVDWDCVPKSIKQLTQETVLRIRNFVETRRIHIEPFFKAFDKANKFHVSRCQMRRILSSHSILLSETEVRGLMERYGDDMGFNYWIFLDEINEKLFCEWKHLEILRLLKLIHERKPAPCSKPDFSVIEVFAKIKGQVTRNRINVEQFMKPCGQIEEGMITETKFRSSFSAAGIILDDCELDVLCKAFKVPCKSGFVDHKKFCSMINQAFYRTELEKLPCTVPVQHFPTTDDSLNFLNFDERCAVSRALQKLSRYHDGASNMKSFFDDVSQHGIINKDCLARVLTSGGLMELINQDELDVIFKCFSLPDGSTRKFDYKNFLMVLKTIKSL